MKSTKELETAQVVDVDAAVKSAIETAPSRALLAEARAKFDELAAKVATEHEEISRLEKFEGENSPAERTKAALEGRQIPDEPNKALLESARIRLNAYISARDVQQKTITALETKLFSEVAGATKLLRLSSVKRAALALAELRNAASDDQAITVAITKAGVRPPGPGLSSNIVADAPILRGLPAESNWLRHVRQLGYAV